MVTAFREIGAADMIIPYYVTSENKSPHRRLLSSAYYRLVLVSGLRCTITTALLCICVTT
jgi:hypothetical protein